MHSSYLIELDNHSNREWKTKERKTHLRKDNSWMSERRPQQLKADGNSTAQE